MMELQSLVLFTFLASLILAVALVVGAYVPFKVNPRSVFLSFCAGVTFAYVFVYVIPQLSVQANMVRSDVLSLLGAMVFFGVDRYVTNANHRYAFVIQMIALSAYTFIIGYDLGGGSSLLSIIAFIVVIGLHLVQFSFDNQKEFPSLYRSVGLWVLAGSVVAGAVLGPVLHEADINQLLALLIGGIIYYSLKEEIPQENSPRYLPFLAGGIIATVFLLLI